MVAVTDVLLGVFILSGSFLLVTLGMKLLVNQPSEKPEDKKEIN